MKAYKFVILAITTLLMACNSNSTTESGQASNSSGSGSSSSSSSSTSSTATSITISQSVTTVEPNGTVSFSASGGTSPYTYAIYSGSGTIGSSTGTYRANDTTGSIVILVKDANGNANYGYLTVASNIYISPQSKSLTGGQSITFYANDGVAPYTYAIVSGGGSISGSVYTAPTYATTAVIQVTDANGAYAQATVSVSAITSLEVAPKSVTIYADESYDFYATGGVEPYAFSIVSGGGSFNGNIYIAGSSPGTVKVKATDAMGRVSTATITVKRNEVEDHISFTTQAITDHYIGISWDNLTYTQPSLVFVGLGSTLNASYLAKNYTGCISSGAVGTPCALHVGLSNLTNQDTFQGVYKAVVTMQGRTATAQLELCVKPSEKNRAYVRWMASDHTTASIKFNSSGKTFISSRTVRADYAVVDSGSGVGYVNISVTDAGYVADTSCGSGFSDSNYIQVQ